jgi:hypothetical protein
MTSTTARFRQGARFFLPLLRPAQGRHKPPAWIPPDEQRATRALRSFDYRPSAFFIGHG